MSASASTSTTEPPKETTRHEKLVERARARDEPTRTKTIRKDYAQGLRGRLAAIRSALREGIVVNDAFGIEALVDAIRLDLIQHPDGSTGVEALVDAPSESQFEFTTDPKKIETARRWLKRRTDQEILQQFGGENEYIERAYVKGLEDAQSELNALGIGGESAAAASVRLPVHQEQLEQLYSRNLSELEGLTDDISKDLRRKLTDGLASGDGPRDIASDLTDIIGRVDGTPRAAMNRATMIARTELMNSHNWARLKEWERAGVTKVDVILATDACPICQSYAADAPYEASKAYGNLPQHPNCRCSHTIWTGD